MLVGAHLASIYEETIDEICNKNGVGKGISDKVITAKDAEEIRTNASKLWRHEGIAATWRVMYSIAGNSAYGHGPQGDALVNLAIPMSVEQVSVRWQEFRFEQDFIYRFCYIRRKNGRV